MFNACVLIVCVDKSFFKNYKKGFESKFEKEIKEKELEKKKKKNQNSPSPIPSFQPSPACLFFPFYRAAQPSPSP
jgi:hypothetical protein